MIPDIVDPETGEVLVNPFAWDSPTPSCRTALESRAEVESLEALHQQRRELVVKFAGLKALHGPFGKWDDKRKIVLADIRLAAKVEADKQGKKITEAMADDMARASDDYKEFVERGKLDHAEYVDSEFQMQSIEDRIRSRELSITAYSRELGLAR